MDTLTELLEKAAESAPRLEELTELREASEAAALAAAKAQDELKAAAVARARIFGWVVVSKEAGVSPKMLHSWAKAIPGTDLSTAYAGKE